MSTTKTVQVSKANVVALAAQINAAVHAGRDVTINGDTPISHNGADAATSWQTGSISYTIAAKKPGAVRQVFVKAGHMLTISSEAPDHHGEAPHAMVKPTKRAKAKPRFAPTEQAPAREAKPRKDDGRVPIAATIKGETGWLTLRTANGGYRYGVTMEDSMASLFRPGGSAERHAARAEKAGIRVHLAQ